MIIDYAQAGTAPRASKAKATIALSRASRISLLAAALASVAVGSPAQARPFGGGMSAWGDPYDPFSGPGYGFDRAPRGNARDPREGRVEVSRFVTAGPAAERLGRGPVHVESESAGSNFVAAGERAVYEAAIVDALVGQGYDTIHANGPGGQTVSLRLIRSVLVPAEEKRSPVSGSAAVSVGTYGSAYGLAVNVDLTKPRPALISTRLEVRIVDPQDGQTLWEGHAQIATREGDDDWSDTRIAGKLADALFDRFPEGEKVAPITADNQPDRFVPAMATVPPG